MKLFDKFKKQTLHSSRLDFSVRGTQYYLDSFTKLQRPNPLWNSTPGLIANCHRTMDKIPEFYYDNYPIKLVPEPKNEHDPNAIKVLISGKLIGYVPSERCLEIKKIMHDNLNYELSAWIRGGKYKIVTADGTVNFFENDLSVIIYLYF